MGHIHVRKYLSLCLHCRSAAEHSEAVVNDAVEEGAALCVGQQLDFLHKELERLQVCCTCVCVRQSEHCSSGSGTCIIHVIHVESKLVQIRQIKLACGIQSCIHTSLYLPHTH